jgi:serine phosphatase RsbU (regulator of sigma subunit)
MHGTALGNLKRLEVERMRGQLKAELEAAGVAQSFIMPASSATLGRIAYAFKSRPGRFASGDLFDAVEMPGGRVGVFLGDVAGKGAAAAITMAVAQTHLRGLLSGGATAREAVESLNRYIAPRNREGQFITLWLGVFDPGAGTVECVDAGHGYFFLRPGGGPPTRPDFESHLVVGIEPEYEYTPSTFPFTPGTRVMTCSDGVIEQNSPVGEQFDRARAEACFAGTNSPQEDVETLVQQVLDYAATDALSDDVTVASVVCL